MAYHSSPRPRHLLLLLSTLCGLLAGCSGSDTCRALRADYDRTLADQEAPKQATGPAKVLLGTLIRGKAIDRVVDARLASLATLTDTRRIDLLGSTLNLTTNLLDVDVHVPTSCNDCLGIDAAVSVTAAVKAGPLPVGSFKTRGIVQLTSPLSLEVKGSRARLMTDLAQANVERIEVELPGLPSSLKHATNQLLTESADALLEGFGPAIEILRQEPITIPGSAVELSATEIKTLPTAGALWIGWTPNVDLPGPAVTPPSTLPKDADVALALAPQTLTLMTRASGKAGLIPTRLNEDLKADPDGSLHVTIDGILPREGHLDTAFTLWRLGGDSCFEARFSATTTASVGTPTKDEAKGSEVTLDVKDIELVSSRGDDFQLSVALWWKSTFLDETLAFQRTVLAAHDLALGDTHFDLNVSAIEPREEGMTVFLTASPSKP